VPKIPATAQGLSEEMGQIYASANAKMDEVFYGVSEAKAEFRLKPKEWTSKEVLAHLIHSERNMVDWATTLVQGAEFYIHTDSLPARLRSTTITYPLIVDLRGELRSAQREGLNFYAEMPAEFVARKSSYVRMAGALIEETAYHYKDHIQQIEKNLAAAKDVN
jgi:hypothetical protein